jgi:hypothetical protein
MNIFVLHKNHKKNVKMYCDKHIVKMLLETAQILSAAYIFTGEPAPYKMSKGHMNHPCVLWSRKSLRNWLWLKELGKEIYKEYKYRYEKNHPSGDLILSMEIPNLSIGKFTYPPKCMPNEYKRKSLVKSYRAYYKYDKVRFCTWKNRPVPKFMKGVMR